VASAALPRFAGHRVSPSPPVTYHEADHLARSDRKGKIPSVSCNHLARHIRLNTELARKPKEALEYVIVHEMAHLLVPIHNAQFLNVLDAHWPGWRSTQRNLNDLPLGV
jgi:predicted metal-dependent hydrolase